MTAKDLIEKYEKEIRGLSKTIDYSVHMRFRRDRTIRVNTLKQFIADIKELDK